MRVWLDTIKIRTEIFKSGLSQREIGEMMGTSQQYVGQIINRGTCRPETLESLAKAIGVEPSKLLDDNYMESQKRKALIKE